MLKRIFIVFLVTIFIFSIYSPATAEDQIRFDRWPLDDLKKESIITDFNEEHFGLDLQAEEGTPVYAPFAGKIYWTYTSGNHGISAGLEHVSGIRITFLHLSERTVKKGQIVNTGDQIGRVGITGSGRDSESAHLHLAVIANADAPISKPEIRYANPLDFLPVLEASEPQEIKEPEIVQLPNTVQSPEIQIQPSPVAIKSIVKTTKIVKDVPKPIESTQSIQQTTPIKNPVKSEVKNMKKVNDKLKTNVKNMNQKLNSNIPIKKDTIYKANSVKSSKVTLLVLKIAAIIILLIAGIAFFTSNRSVLNKKTA